MRAAFSLALLLAAAALQTEARDHKKRRGAAPGLYDLKGLVDAHGDAVDMAALKGQVSLVVNVASE